jgi:hypothetical protein
MTDQQAERWIVTSALIVAGIYAYRRLIEQPASPPVKLKQIAGVGQLPPLGAWATAWGFTYLVIAVIATAAPELAAAFAILIATGELLTNSGSIFADVGKQEKTGTTGQTAQTTAAAAAGNLVNLPGGGVGVYQPPTNLQGISSTFPDIPSTTIGTGHQGLQ